MSRVLLQLLPVIAALGLLSRSAKAECGSANRVQIEARISDDADDEFTQSAREPHDKFVDPDEPGLLTTQRAQAPRILRPSQFLILRFYPPSGEAATPPISIGDADIRAITYETPASSGLPQPDSPWTGVAGKNVLVLDIPEAVTKEAKHKDRIGINIELSGGQCTKFFADFNATPQLYGAAGFWIPIGLFSSNLREGPQGISFAVQPVNLAWGVKFLTGKAFYFGVSVAGGWAITSNTGSHDAAPTDPNAKGGFTIGAATGSVLLDLGAWAYVGGSYLADFRKGQGDPGLVVTLGPGPKLLGAVAGLGD